MAIWAAALLAATLMSVTTVHGRPSSVAEHHSSAGYRRLRRAVSLHGQTVNEMDRERLLELIARVDLSRCFAKWVCDILARGESQRAAEERDLAALFTEEELNSTSPASSDPDSPRAVYLAAAARGHASAGNQSACAVASCRAQPQDMLQMLREIEGLGDLVRQARVRQRQRAPLVVFGVEEGEAARARGRQDGRQVLFGVEEGDGPHGPQTVLFEVVEGGMEETGLKKEERAETVGTSENEGKKAAGEDKEIVEETTEENYEPEDVRGESSPAEEPVEESAEDERDPTVTSGKDSAETGKDIKNVTTPDQEETDQKSNKNGEESKMEIGSSDAEKLASVPSPK